MKTLTLVLDYSIQPYSIGDTLMALAGAQAVLDEHEFRRLKINCIVDPSKPHVNPCMADAHSRGLESLERLKPLFQLVDTLEAVEVNTKIPRDAIVWPMLGRYLYYDAIRCISAYHRRHGIVPQFRFKKEDLEWARHISQGHKVFTTNLRQSLIQDHRNCDWKVWGDAVDYCGTKYGARFIIVGTQDEVHQSLRGLPCLEFAKDHGSTLLQDLALLHCSKAHIGTTSGPMVIPMMRWAPYFFTRADMTPHLARYDGELRQLRNSELAFSWSAPFQSFYCGPETHHLLVQRIESFLKVM